jgi:hypothetical protein
MAALVAATHFPEAHQKNIDLNAFAFSATTASGKWVAGTSPAMTV